MITVTILEATTEHALASRFFVDVNGKRSKVMVAIRRDKHFWLYPERYDFTATQINEIDRQLEEHLTKRSI